ncbi:UvrD-helicase domain-containing protein [Paenibacillus anseongense]|uniref:UvrD-helicase domain-containing protein n=1 Tax=Paenibacillus anseongense TaxID=2682845 RepID=UPI002DC00BB0|nr:UvrD-helicase domain-containing protein [Paenibacillus anseongense]MEC0269704.1 3'-5' exonuclease [Paenibacillus anseongense]
MTMRNDNMKLKPNIKFFYAVLGQKFDEVDRFLNQPDVSSNLNAEDSGRTVLIYAAERGLLDMIEMLILRGGADPNYVSTYGMTALDFAKSKNQTEAVEKLKYHGGLSIKDLDAAAKSTSISEPNQVKRKRKKIFNISPNFQEEQEYLNGTIDLIYDRLHQVEKQLPNAGADRWTRRALSRHFAENVENLKSSLHIPYFGRVDFQHENKNTKESFYIGKFSLSDEKNKLKVISWTTPAGSLFYARHLGRIEKHQLGNGDVTLIRNISIENQLVTDIQDAGQQGLFDPLLVSKLQGEAKSSMKDIVETIQAEQDNIIRISKNKPVIVQGSAGSGKTTVALHRLAYLFHNHPELSPDKMIIFGPNQMFLSYIKEVLPGLGLEGVEQISFDHWAQKRLSRAGYQFLKENLYQLYESPLSAKWCNWRGSIRCKEVLDDIINKFTNQMAPSRGIHIVFKEFIFELRLDELRRWYLEDYKFNKLITRREKILKNIKMRFDWYVKELKRKFETPERGLPQDIKTAITELSLQFQNEYLTLTNSWPVKNEFDIYFNTFSNLEWLSETLLGWSHEEITFVHNAILWQKENKYFAYEDIAPLLHIRDSLTEGIGIIQANTPTTIKYQYMIVDEAQDFSPFQLWLVSRLTVNGGMMILGDLGQGIHSYRGMTQWSDAKNMLGNNTKLCMLTTSYRSTIEIIQAANAIIEPWSREKFELSQPILRRGNKPRLIKCDDIIQLSNHIPKLVRELQTRGRSQIAIITKNDRWNLNLSKILEMNGIEVELVKDANSAQTKRVVVIDAAISKGLEFDAVILFDISINVYNDNEFDRKLLYIALTRALHEVHLTSTVPSVLIGGMQADFLDIES